MTGIKKKRNLKNLKKQIIEKTASQYKKSKKPFGINLSNNLLKNKYDNHIKKLKKKMLDIEELKKKIKELKKNYGKGILASKDPKQPPKKKDPKKKLIVKKDPIKKKLITKKK